MWEKLKALADRQEDNKFIGPCIYIQYSKLPEIETITGQPELTLIDAGRETSEQWLQGILCLAKSDVDLWEKKNEGH